MALRSLRGAWCVVREILRTTRHAPRFIFFIALTLFITACAETPHATRTPVRLSIGDATEHAALLAQLIDAYTKDHEWVIISIELLKPNETIDQLTTSKIDLAIVPSAIKPSSTIWTSGFGYDSIVVVVNPSNPTNGLSLAQLRDLFQGKTFDWTPFGGTGDVIPVSREANALTRLMFEERVMGNRAVTQNAVLQPSAQNVIDFVANTPGAIGYASITDATSKVKILSIEGVTPNSTTAAANQYLLSAPIYLLAQSEPSGDLREFVAWLLSEAGQKMISQAGLGRVR
jgi:phosphate transport system substrate-binding protein